MCSFILMFSYDTLLACIWILNFALFSLNMNERLYFFNIVSCFDYSFVPSFVYLFNPIYNHLFTVLLWKIQLIEFITSCRWLEKLLDISIPSVRGGGFLNTFSIGLS
jgi:hypothetical protein